MKNQMKQLTQLIQLSRPRFWLYTAGPYLLGSIASVSTWQSLLSWQFWLGMLIFTVPVNLWVYGVNDLADADTDEHNDKKGQYEAAWTPQQRQRLVLGAVLVSVVGILWWSLFVDATARAILGVFLGLAAAYSLPPWRFKARPFIDSISNGFYILPAAVAIAQWGGTWPPVLIWIAGWAWTMAMHTFSAVPDIKADTQANVPTTATKLGKKNALLWCAFWWLVAAASLAEVTGHWLPLLGLVYPFTALAVWKNKKLDPFTVYRVFPWLNALVGATLFWWIVFERGWVGL